jgi:hypothetical protein
MEKAYILGIVAIMGIFALFVSLGPLTATLSGAAIAPEGHEICNLDLNGGAIVASDLSSLAGCSECLIGAINGTKMPEETIQCIYGKGILDNVEFITGNPSVEIVGEAKTSDGKSVSYMVRLLEGTFKGLEGWAPSVMVQC